MNATPFDTSKIFASHSIHSTVTDKGKFFYINGKRTTKEKYYDIKASGTESCFRNTYHNRTLRQFSVVRIQVKK